MKTRSVGAELFHADGQTERHDGFLFAVLRTGLKTNRQQSITSNHTEKQRYTFLLQLYELQQTLVE